MLTIQGVYLGSRVVPYGSEGKSRIEIGLLTTHSNAFGKNVESTDIIRVPAARAGEVSAWDKNIDKPVSIAVFVQAFPTRSGAGFSYYLQNDHSPLQIGAVSSLVGGGSDVFGSKK